ncbi:hypothetical protein K32_42530 [Kaistia sp. 32K]|nr:hypothetical protein K32_42530 [Kaistia sp. 32K]
MLGKQLAEANDHARHGEQTTVAGSNLDEIGDETADPGLGQNGRDSAELIVGCENRALDEANEIVALAQKGRKTRQIGIDGVERAALEGQIKQCRRIPLGDP